MDKLHVELDEFDKLYEEFDELFKLHAELGELHKLNYKFVKFAIFDIFGKFHYVPLKHVNPCEIHLMSMQMRDITRNSCIRRFSRTNRTRLPQTSSFNANF